MMLLAGLGNPGREYELTRHNAGFLAADELAGRVQVRSPKRAFQGVLGKGEYKGLPVLIFKPETFMNNSGQALRAVADYYRLKPQDILVLCDDFDLPFGSLRLRTGGGPGTHNGLKSAVEHLGRDFNRLRIGIGSFAADPADFVLSRFSKAELPQLKGIVAQAADAALCALEQGMEAAMRKYNQKTGTPAQTERGESSEPT